MRTLLPRVAVWLAAASVWAGPGAAFAQFESLRALESKLDAAPSSSQELMAVRAEFTAPTERRPGLLRITAEIAEGWHTYSITQASGGPNPTVITVEQGDGFSVKGPFRATPAPDAHPEPAFGGLIVEEHSGVVTWEAPLEFAKNADLASLEIRGYVRAQLCSSTCLPPRRFEFVARLASNAASRSGRAHQAPAASGHRGIAADEREGTNSAGPGEREGATPAGRGGPESATPAGRGEPDTAIYRPDGLHATVGIRFEPPVAAPGKTLELIVRIEPDPGYHVYGLPEEMGDQVGMPTIVALESGTPLVAGQVRASRPVERHPSQETGNTGRYYTRPVEFSLPLTVPRALSGPEVSLSGLVGLQTCTDRNCDRHRAVRFKAVLPVGTARAQTPVRVDFEAARYGEAVALLPGGKLPQPGAPATDSSPQTGFAGQARGVAAAGSAGFWGELAVAIALGFVGGLILNVMPCVLPVIGLKVLSFVEQCREEREHAAGDTGGVSFRRGRAFWLNVWYSFGIISVFLLLATISAALGLKWGEHFQSLAFKVTMAGLVFAMALSFLGVWEIPIPGFAGGKGANKLAQREGAVGAFAKGVLTTVLATPCSGPFLGAVFGFTFPQPIWVKYAVFGSIGLGMSSPYLVIGVFPRLIRWLPKPGEWMETFKQVMGFTLLATVVWLLMAVREDHLVATVALLFGLWAGLWLVGRTPVYAPLGRRLMAWAWGAVLMALLGGGGFWLLRPHEEVVAWKPFSRQALEAELARGRTVLLDFTADWCATCKLNEKWALNKRVVQQTLEELDAIAMRADWTEESPEIKQLLDELGYASIPLCVIYPAGRAEDAIVLPDLITTNQVLAALRKAGPSRTASSSTAMNR